MPNQYWEKRMQEIEERSHEIGMDYARYTERQFNIATRAIDKKISYWYQKMVDNNGVSLAAAKEMLRKDELEEFHWSVEEYIKKGEILEYDKRWENQLINASAKVHISRLEAMKLQMQQECEVLYGNLSDGLDKTMTEIYTQGYYHTAYELMKGTKLGTTVVYLDTRRIEKAVQTAWANDGKNFTARCWDNKNKLINELNTILTQNIIRGEAPGKAIDQLSKKMKVSRYNAGRLIMTESAFISSKCQNDCYKDLGVEKFEFVATLDSLTSEICRSMDGQVFKLSDYKIGLNAPPLHCFCRSCTVPYFDDDYGQIGERAARGEDGKTTYVPSNMTYEEWKEQYVKKPVENSNILNSGEEKVYPISTKSINNVPLIKIGNMSDEEANRLQMEHKNVLDFAKDNNSYEVGMIFDDKLNEINRAIGDATSVDLNIPGRTHAKYVIHNHPNNASFSNRDIIWLINNENVRYFSIVKNNGSVEILYVPDDFNRKLFINEYKRLEKKYDKDIAKDTIKGYTKVIEKLVTKTKSGIVYKR